MEDSPTPWSISGNEIVYQNGSVAEVNNPDNAAFIVRAVNAHEELISACKEALEWVLATEVREQLSKAIARAEGRS